jgi:hypothetical protein
MLGLKPVLYAQTKPILYFCETYDPGVGEIGISDRFTTGYLTIMVRADQPLGLKNVFIQMDKYNPDTRKFEFYKKFNYTVDPDMKYIYFAKNEESDLRFGEAGFYRVFLLNDENENVASSLVEIID